MRENIAYLFMIGILILLVTVMFGVLGRGEYHPPSPKEKEKASTSQISA